MRSIRRIAAWVGVWLVLWQAALAGGLAASANAQPDAAHVALVICTGHGLVTLDASGVPVDPAKHSTGHGQASCPCCLPFSPCGASVLAPEPLVLSAPPRIVAARAAPTADAPILPPAPARTQLSRGPPPPA